MLLLHVTMVVFLVWVNVVAVGILAGRVISNYAIAKIAGVVGACVALFSLEHFFPLGKGAGIFHLVTLFSCGLVFWKRHLVWRHRGTEILFLAGFLYCLAWRLAFPDIDTNSERLPNLAFIQAYMTGERLPPVDQWLPPYRANFYYTFQHYCAALLGRWTGIDGGEAYQMGYCTMVALISVAVGHLAAALCVSKAGRALSYASVMLGGTGAVVWGRLLLKGNPGPYDYVRFVGGSLRDSEKWQSSANSLGMFLDLPCEPPSYTFISGDFHPPLAGLLLLMFALLVIAVETRERATGRQAIYAALLAATVPLALLSNAWVFPLHTLLIVAWFIHVAIRRDTNYWISGVAGAGVCGVLLFPALIQFTASRNVHESVLRLVSRDWHTPFGEWLLLFYPVLGLLALACFEKGRPLAKFWVCVWMVLLLFSECVFFDDPYGENSQRFNTTLKWWLWVYGGALATLGPVCLGSASRVIKYGAAALMFPPMLLHAWELAEDYHTIEKPHALALRGSGWIDRDVSQKEVIVALRSRPPGIALESKVGHANSVAPAITLFAGKTCFLGWTFHENLWRNSLFEIRQREKELAEFYASEMDDPLSWLISNNIQYVLWLPRDNGENSGFRELKAKLAPNYAWKNLCGENDDFAVGFWERYR